jgi:hypothetical protein
MPKSLTVFLLALAILLPTGTGRATTPAISNDDVGCLDLFEGCSGSSTAAGCASLYCDRVHCGCAEPPPGATLHFSCQCDASGCRRTCQVTANGH